MSLLGKTISGEMDEISQVDAYIIPLVGPREDISESKCNIRLVSIKFDSLLCKKEFSENYNVLFTIGSNNIQTQANKFPGIANYDLRKKVINLSIFSYNDFIYVFKNLPGIEPDVLIDAELQLTECPNKKGSYCAFGRSKISKKNFLQILGKIDIAYNNIYSRSILKIN
jgi:hypothetical protein